MKSKVKHTKSGAIAVQATSDAGDVVGVGIGNLRVLLFEDGPFWFAQAIEVDYGCQGDNPEDAKSNFERGLWANIDLQIRVNGNIDELLVFAPSDILKEVKDKESIHLYTQISCHHVDHKVPKGWPFTGIDYYQKLAA